MAPGRRRRGNIDKQASTSGVCRGKLTIMAAALASSSTIGKKEKKCLRIVSDCHLKLSTSDSAAQTKNSHKRPWMLNTMSHPICWKKEAKLKRKKKNVGTASTVEPLCAAWALHYRVTLETVLSWLQAASFLMLQKWMTQINNWPNDLRPLTEQNSWISNVSLFSVVCLSKGEKCIWKCYLGI